VVVSFGDRCVCVTGGFFWIVVGHISLIVSKPKTTEISLIVIDRLSFSPLAISSFAFTRGVSVDPSGIAVGLILVFLLQSENGHSR